jgi:hypothetical protein
MPIDESAYAAAWRKLRARETTGRAPTGEGWSAAFDHRKNNPRDLSRQFAVLTIRTGAVPHAADDLPDTLRDRVYRCLVLRKVWRPEMRQFDLRETMRREYHPAYTKGEAQTDWYLMQDVSQ